MTKDIKVKLTIVVVMVLIFLPIGGYLLSRGITGSVSTDTEHFATVDAYYAGCEVYSVDSSTYSLIYTYTVDGKIFQIKTNYGTSMIPKLGSVRQVRYDPADPTRAVLAGPSSDLGLIFGGALFVLVPLIILLGCLLKFGVIKKGFKLLDLCAGSVLVLCGFFALYFIGGGFSVVQAFETAGPLALIPVLLFVVGIVQLFRCFFPGNKRT